MPHCKFLFLNTLYKWSSKFHTFSMTSFMKFLDALPFSLLSLTLCIVIISLRFFLFILCYSVVYILCLRIVLLIIFMLLIKKVVDSSNILVKCLLCHALYTIIRLCFNRILLLFNYIKGYNIPVSVTITICIMSFSC